MLKEQKALYVEMGVTWKQFSDAGDKVKSGLADAVAFSQAIDVPNDLTECSLFHEKARKALEILKKAKFSLDSMDNKGQILLKHCEQIQDFDKSMIENQLSKVHEQWEKAYDSILLKTQELETQLIIWKQIDDSKNEVLHWLGDTSKNLTSACNNITDVETGQMQLNRYKDELPAHYNLKASIIAKSAQLVKLNKVSSIPTLDTLNKLLDDEFLDVKNRADKLEGIAYGFIDQEKNLRAQIKEASDTITNIRESVIKCDDLTGENSKILGRLQKCQELKKDLSKYEGDIYKINLEVDKMKELYPSFTDSGLAKEISGIRKRYDGVVSHSEKIESTLLTFLKKHHSERFSNLQRLVTALREKLLWCAPEAGSDRYNLEVKATSLQDVETGLSDCDAKRSELEQSLQLLECVESAQMMTELKEGSTQLITEMENLKTSYITLKQLLEYNVDLWQKYELMSENLSSWLREMEGKVRSESVSQINLLNIMDKITEMKDVLKIVTEFESEVKNISNVSSEIMKENPESRVAQYVGNISMRYQSVLKFVKSFIERLEDLKKSKDSYTTSVGEVRKWLSDAECKLKDFEVLFTSPVKPSQAYQTKLDEIKAFTVEREKGQILLNKAIECGETLFSGTTPENREMIRTELRNLRDASESLIDKSNSIHRRVESMMMQRSSFDDSYQQIRKWIKDTEIKVGNKFDLKASLKDKKISMNIYRSVSQDVATHKNIINQLQEKITNLSDSDASAKFEEILRSYENLSKNVEQFTMVSEKHVVDHEMYLQVLEKSHDWLTSLAAEATGVVDEIVLEKDGADVKLAIIDDILHQKDEGDQLINNCHNQLQIVLEQTDISGHPALLKEFEEQKGAWESFLSRCNDAQSKLRQLCCKWTEFEEVIESLTGWIKQKELQVKDQSLRNTQEAKQTHLDKLKLLEEEIVAKGDDFASASEQSQLIEGESELSTKVSRLLTRYQALKNVTKVSSHGQNFIRNLYNFRDTNSYLQN